MPAPINTASDLRKYLSRGEISLLERSQDIGGFSQDVNYLTGKVSARLQTQGIAIEIHPEAIIQEQAAFFQQSLPIQKAQENPSSELGSSLLGIGEALTTPLFREDQQSHGIRELHQQQRQQLSEEFSSALKELPQDFSSLSETDTNRLKTVIAKLQTDTLLEDNVNEFRSRLQRVGQETNIGTTTIIQDIDKSYTSLLQEKENKEQEEIKKAQQEGKTYKNPRSLDVNKIMEALQKAKTPQERLAIFQNILAHQQGLAAYDLDHILTKRKANFLGFGQKSLLPKRVLKEISKQRKKELLQKRQVAKSTNTSHPPILPVQTLSRVFSDSSISTSNPAQSQRTYPREEVSERRDGSPSLIDTAQRAVTTAKRIKKIVDWISNLSKIGEGGEALGGLGGLLFNPWTLAILGGIFLLIVLLFILILLIQNGTVSTSGGTPPGQKLCPDATPPTAGQMLTILQQQFNIRVHGSDENVISHIYSTSCTLSQYTFTQLMHVPSIKIDLYIDDAACSGHTQGETGGYRVDIHPCASPAGDQFIITHEFAHVIQFENSKLVGAFCSQAYHGAIIKGHCESSSPSTLPTFNCLRDYTHNYDSPNPAECFSDMAGAFLTYKDFHDTLIIKGQIIPSNYKQMDNYPTNFPQYYNFASQNLFLPNTSTANASQLVSIAQSITSHLSKTFGRAIDLYDQIKPNPPGRFQLPNSPNPNYIVLMRGGKACARINGDLECVNSRYWCTDLLIDTYNIVLGHRVLGEDLGTVEDMINFWKKPSTSGFVFVHYRSASEHQGALTALYATKPNLGDALFFESVEGSHNGFEHVALIRDMSLDPSGNGFIKTYEANSGSITGTYPISHWQIKNTPYPVTGFGLYTNGAKTTGGL